MNTKDDWKPWHEERERFYTRDTEGFILDLEALKAHILKLQQVCPKDKAGWPHSTALVVLDLLHKEYFAAKKLLELNNQVQETHYNQNLVA